MISKKKKKKKKKKKVKKGLRRNPKVFSGRNQNAPRPPYNLSTAYNRWLRLQTMLLPGRIYIALSLWHFGDFRNIFLPNISEDQKKSYDLSAGPLVGTAT